MENRTGTLTPPIRKDFNPPWWVILLFECFSTWQMAIIYYSSNAFTLGGVTPLPVSVDNTTLIIVMGYILGAVLAYLRPHKITVWGKLIVILSLLCTALLFMPLPEQMFASLYYVNVLCCVLLISVEAVLTIYLYSFKSAVLNAVIAVGLLGVFTPLLQNDLFHVDFRIFNICAVVLQGMVLIGLFYFPNRLPIRFLPKRADPGETKKDRVRPPKILLWWTISLCIAAACITLISSTVAESLPNGIAIVYLSSGFAGALFWLLYRKCKISPFRLTTIWLAVTAFGFLLWLLPFTVTKYIGIVLQGPGMIMALLCWFFAGTLYESWPSRLVAPISIFTALFSAGIHAGLMEALRENTAALYAVYAVFAVAVLLLYFLVKPFYEQAWFRAAHPEKEEPTPASAETPDETEPIHMDEATTGSLESLTAREQEIADLLVQGYTSRDVASLLTLSEYTVRTHNKNIYRKLDVHNRYELIALVSRRDDENIQ